MKRAVVTATIFVFAILFAQAQDSSVPELINYQGKLTDESGNLLEGVHKLEFNIWSQASLGTKLWGPQTFPSVQVVQGHFNVILGPKDVSERLIVDAFAASERYLEILVDDSIISPRQRILSAPYAIRSEHAHRLSGGNVTFQYWKSGPISSTMAMDKEKDPRKVPNSDMSITATGKVLVIGLKPAKGKESNFRADYNIRPTSWYWFNKEDYRANWWVVIGTVKDDDQLDEELARIRMPDMDPYNHDIPSDWDWGDGRWISHVNRWAVEAIQKTRPCLLTLPFSSVQTTLLDLPPGQYDIALFIERKLCNDWRAPAVSILNFDLYAYEVGGQGQ